MEIIKKGSGEVWKKIVQCRHVKDVCGLEYEPDIRRCESLLEINQDDVYYKHWTKYPDLEGEDYCVTCPVCGAPLPIESSSIPGWVKKMAKDAYDKEQAEKMEAYKRQVEETSKVQQE